MRQLPIWVAQRVTSPALRKAHWLWWVLASLLRPVLAELILSRWMEKGAEPFFQRLGGVLGLGCYSLSVAGVRVSVPKERLLVLKVSGRFKTASRGRCSRREDRRQTLLG